MFNIKMRLVTKIKKGDSLELDNQKSRNFSEE